MNPLVTVIVASYNEREFLEQAIESVLAQTYDNLEIILVDNGSTDGSQEILKRYARPSVQLILHERNIHITTKLNDCVARANGEYISILHGDDYYHPEKIERQVAAFQTLPADYGVVYGPVNHWHTASGRRTVTRGIRESGDILPALLNFTSQGFMDLIAALFKRECLERYRYYEDLFVEGEAIFFRIAMGYKFHYLEEPLVVMRDYGATLGKDYNANLRLTMTVLDRLEDHPDFPPRLAGDLQRLKSRMLRDYGWQSIRIHADTAKGRDRLLQAIGQDWRQTFHPRVMAGLALGVLPRRTVQTINTVVSRVMSLV